MKAKGVARLALCITFIAALPGAPARAGTYTCPPPDAALQGSPLPPQGGVTPPVRTDPDGAQTVTLNVEDPVDARPGAYQYTHVSVPSPVGGTVGVFVHRWPVADRRIETVGVFRIDGTIRRFPLLIVENAPADDVLAAAMNALEAEENPVLTNTTPYALNTVAPTPLGFFVVLLLAGGLSGSVPVAGGEVATAAFDLAFAWMMYFNQYPQNVGYDDRIPLYVWNVYRTAAGAEAWSGVVVTHTGRWQTSHTGGTTTGEGCRRTRMGEVARTTAGTTYLGGVYLLEHSLGSSAVSNFDAEEDVTVGITAGSADVPVTTVRQTEHKDGPQTLLYAKYQKDEIALGVDAGGTFVPLIGTRAESWHSAPPDAQKRLISLGVFDPTGAYHPVLGARTHFERVPADLWVLSWALGGGPGDENAGDWQADLGTFDTTGAFVPVWGITYAEEFEGAIYPYRMMITMGPWIGAQYEPALGLTYDGETTSEGWALSDAAGGYAGMGRWYVSAGTFSPLGGYVPVAGVAYAPGKTSAQYSVVEEYSLGVFPTHYSAGGASQFIPVACARWSSTITSGAWAAGFATSSTLAKAPASGRADIGAVTPAGDFAPVAGATFTAGRPDHYGIGIWAGSSFVPVMEACYSPGLVALTPAPDPTGNHLPFFTPSPGQGAVGVAAGSGSSRTSLAWIGTKDGQPSFGTMQDCPA